jgi:hypothetical protein
VKTPVALALLLSLALASPTVLAQSSSAGASDEPAGPAPCTTDWQVSPTGAGGVGPMIFSALKRTLAAQSGVDIGMPCGPMVPGCEGPCVDAYDQRDGYFLAQTTTTGWVFYRHHFDAAGYTDGQTQWVPFAGQRRPLVLGAPYWLCEHPNVVRLLGLPICP